MSSSGKKDLGSTKGGKTLHQGLYRKNPHACDSSTKLPTKTSVNEGATRTEVGRATNNLGPRVA
jgi:hypothetical protein